MANVTFNKLAVRKMQEILDSPEGQGKMIRVIYHAHGDHAHYGLDLSEKTQHDEVIDAGGVEVLVDKRELDWLDGVSVKYLLYPEEGWKITNPSKNSFGDH